MSVYRLSLRQRIFNIIITVVWTSAGLIVLLPYLLGKSQIDLSATFQVPIGIAFLLIGLVSKNITIILTSSELKVVTTFFWFIHNTKSVPWASIQSVKRAKYIQGIPYFYLTKYSPYYALDISYLDGNNVSELNLYYGRVSNREHLLREIHQYVGNKFEETPNEIITRTQRPFIILWIFYLTFVIVFLIFIIYLSDFIY
jgi:hypothetical protein